MELTFSGDVVETIGFRREVSAQRDNLTAVDAFFGLAGCRRSPRALRETPHLERRAGRRRLGPARRVHDSGPSHEGRGRLLASYIRSRRPHSELRDWTVALIDNSQARATVTVAGHEVGLTFRSYYKSGHDAADAVPVDGDFTVRRLG